MNTEEDSEAQRQSRCAACRRWIQSPPSFMYLNYLLCRWGDRMWQFAVGLYLVHLSDGELFLAAVFGFTCGGLILLLGGLIGDWVDRNSRLKVVRVSLVTQNSCVAACCVVVCVRLVYVESWWRHLLETCVIALAVCAQLASVAYKIAIEKDWIVVIAAGEKSLLANLNAVTRSLDLSCKILSPTVAGLIMTYASLSVSAVVIAAWNVFSLVAEYAILSRVYQLVPDLAVKHQTPPVAAAGDVNEAEMLAVDDVVKSADVNVKRTEEVSSRSLADDDNSHVESDALNADHTHQDQDHDQDQHQDEDHANHADGDDRAEADVRKGRKSRLLTLVTGWRTYARQSVVFAGVSLAMLYMTVLGFDSITVGYIYSSGVSELVVGVCMGLAGATGILGTFLFTRLRRRLGLERTGIIAFSAEVTCLSLAVASVWAPGSPFDLSQTQPSASTTDSSLVTSSYDVAMTSQNDLVVTSSSWREQGVVVNVSVILLLVGIISSRVGLWMADLVVTQSMQESVAESERGVVGGVQNSLNMLLEMLKFALVICVPQIHLFGIHVLLSFSFIFSAGLLFWFHAWRVHRTCYRLCCLVTT